MAKHTPNSLPNRFEMKLTKLSKMLTVGESPSLILEGFLADGMDIITESFDIPNRGTDFNYRVFFEKVE